MKAFFPAFPCLSLKQKEFGPSRSSCLEDNAQRCSPRGLHPPAELTEQFLHWHVFLDLHLWHICQVSHHPDRLARCPWSSQNLYPSGFSKETNQEGVCVYIFTQIERGLFLRNWLMQLWGLASPTFAGQDSWLETEGRVGIAVFSAKVVWKHKSFCLQGTQSFSWLLWGSMLIFEHKESMLHHSPLLAQATQEVLGEVCKF